MQQAGESTPLNDQEQMFLSMAEQLSHPFLQISRLAEIAKTANAGSVLEYWAIVEAISGASMHLVESYALSLRVNGHVTPLAIEPVTVSSLLYDTAQQLEPYAKQYGIELELDTGQRLEPILTDRTVLQSAMASLGQVFVLAQAESDKPNIVRLAAHRSRYGIVAGLYGSAGELGTDGLERAQVLRGRARQPLQKLVSGPATGVFVADSLLAALSARLHVARYHKLTGLAATLQPSQQLQLV